VTNRSITTKALGPDFPVPIDDRYFEDYLEGGAYEYGHTSVTEEEIVRYAELYDPQSMHVDREWATHGPFGQLIASGWHTSALMMRLFADHYISSVASIASPGCDELRWAVPVRAGDELRLRVTTVEARRSRSKPDRGLLRTRVEMINQRDEVPLRMTAMNLVLLRDPTGS
jgi:acyl dehydratase